MHNQYIYQSTQVFTYGVDEKKSARENFEHGLETILNFLFAWNTRRMDVINTRADLIRVSIMLEGVKEFHVGLRGLNRDDIGIKTLDGWEDVIEIRVAEV